MNTHELLQAGQIHEAVAEASEAVKKKPTDFGVRATLCEALLLAGDLDRADTHLNVLTQQDAQSAPQIALFRQLVRAEQARRQFHQQGRVPEFLGDPTPAMKLLLQASIASRDGHASEAADLIAQAEEARPKPQGQCNGEPFNDLRDLDDFTSAVCETLASNGKYFWIAWESVASLQFHPAERSIDLVWRKATMDVAGGPEGEVYIPAIYAASYDDEDVRLRLGRSTLWKGEENEPVAGVGQRTLLIGEKDIPIMEIQEIVVKTEESGE